MADSKYKKRGSTLTLGIILVALLAVTAYLVLSLEPESKSEPEQGEVAVVEQTEDETNDVAATTIIHAGDVAPDFTAVMLDGSNVTLSALQGKPTLLLFWATWCPPCRE